MSMKHAPAPMRWFAVFCIAAATGAILTGCSQYIDPDVPEPIRPFVEPTEGGEYLLYRPSIYDRRREWPLIVVCHGSFPDNANRQMRDWTLLAEERGFLVLVPTMQSAERSLYRKDAEESHRLREDEKHIIASVQHVRAAHTISFDRVLIVGCGKGGEAALFTGLKHPELFRCVALIEPAFEADLFDEVTVCIDPHQPVLVAFDSSDVFRGGTAKEMLTWLQDHGVNWRQGFASPDRKQAALRAVDFFEQMLVAEPLVRLVIFAPDDESPLAVQFRLQTSIEPVSYDWSFGDGDTSPVASPRHVYRLPGVYEVNVTVRTAHNETYRRRLFLRVPECTTSFYSPSTETGTVFEE